jgi:hypothetical protein
MRKRALRLWPRGPDCAVGKADVSLCTPLVHAAAAPQRAKSPYR